MIRIHLVALRAEPGALWIAGTARGVHRVGFGAPPAVPPHTALANRGVCRIGRRAGPLEPAVAWLKTFLEGEVPGPTPPLDLEDTTVFTRAVLDAVARIPIGQLRTYDDIAHALGSPRAARAVGQALSANPLPILVPCHRVVKKHGEIGDYIGGRAWKQFLLAMETSQLGLQVSRKRHAGRS